MRVCIHTARTLPATNMHRGQVMSLGLLARSCLLPAVCDCLKGCDVLLCTELPQTLMLPHMDSGLAFIRSHSTAAGASPLTMSRHCSNKINREQHVKRLHHDTHNTRECWCGSHHYNSPRMLPCMPAVTLCRMLL